jgi:hypothetical protein
MLTVTGYIRRLDLDGQIRLREKDDLFSPIVFEGFFPQELRDVLREAFHEVSPVTIFLNGNQVTGVEIEKFPPDISYELT